jgi:TRAP-type mannitol/chloroaromatic compound transport system permease large subunit
MSDPALGLTMLALIVIAIMMGFPTAFTLMGLGMFFGYVAFYTPGEPLLSNKIFDLMVQRSFGVMTNDTLLSVPLFVFMGYVIERAALVDRMFHSVQLAFRRVPASLAVTTLLVCTFWGIASGIVGAVVVLMGVIAMRPMLRAGYDVRLASGVITAGGTLGILIPPSVMIIVYAAVAGMSVVKLYAAAMLPGFFLALLYLVYIVGWAIINPKVAPKLDPKEYTIAIPPWLEELGRVFSPRALPALALALVRPARVASAVATIGYGGLLRNFLAALCPFIFTAITLWGIWWYAVIYNAADTAPAPVPAAASTPAAPASDAPTPAGSDPVPAGADADAPPQLAGSAQDERVKESDAPPESVNRGPTAASGGAMQDGKVALPDQFYTWFWASTALCALLLLVYYWRMDGEQLEILKQLLESVVPLGVLTFVVLAVILFGITTASESAAVGVVGALFLAGWAKYPRLSRWMILIGGVIGFGAGVVFAPSEPFKWFASFLLGAGLLGTVVVFGYDFVTRRLLVPNAKQSVFLTAKTTAMVCWLFIGSALFSAVFALHGGQQLIERWVLSFELTPVQFLLLSQAIIFLLGWPLEWTEIIVIFVPIFLPLLTHFNVDPVLFATMVAVNLQAAFLSPPVAMSAFYLKGVSPPHVTLNQIFAGMMPYMLIVILCLVLMYVWPGMTLWLPDFLYGR